MIIHSSKQLTQIRDEGGYVQLNKQGQLETQSRISHFFQRFIDAFRSLSATGRAAIKARNAARDAAMEALLRKGTLVNVARTPIPRPTIPVAPSSRAAAPDAPVLQSIKDEVHTLVKNTIAETFPQMDEESRSLLIATVEKEAQDLPELAKSIDNRAQFLKENVAQLVRQFTGDIRGEATNGEQAPARSPQSGKLSYEMQEQIRTEAEDFLNREYPQLDANGRDALITGVTQQLQTLADVADQFDRETLKSFVNDYLKDNLISLPPSGLSRRDIRPLRTLKSEQDITPNTIVCQGNNTCFMLSVVNSMMTTEKGRHILKENLLPGGRLWHTVQNNPHETPWVTEKSFSDLECLLASAYKPTDPFWIEGDIGTAIDFARLLGMKSACYNLSHAPVTTEEQRIAEFQVRLPRPHAVENIQQRLEEGKMVLLRHNLHYRAVVGTDGDRLILRNSMGQGREEYVPISWLDDAEVDVLEYPED